MATMSFSVDEKTKKDIERFAKETRSSRSDVLRDIVRWYRLDKQIDVAQAIIQEKFREYNIKTFNDLEKFLVD